MNVGICAILTDFRGRLLLRQPAGSTLSPPHDPLEPGRLPSDALAHLVRAQTGLIIWPVRLTGLYYRRGVLTFCWRCAMRGGNLPAPEGQPPAGFFDSAPLPAGLATTWRRRLDDALRHAGGPPILRVEAAPAASLGRLLGRAPAAGPWAVTVALWAEVAPGRGLWQRAPEGEPWRLPRVALLYEAPWAAAGRLLRSLALGARWAAPRLALVQVADDRPAMTLVFTAGLTSGEVIPTASLVAADVSGASLDPADKEIAGILDLTGESPPFCLVSGQGANDYG